MLNRLETNQNNMINTAMFLRMKEVALKIQDELNEMFPNSARVTELLTFALALPMTRRCLCEMHRREKLVLIFTKAVTGHLWVGDEPKTLARRIREKWKRIYRAPEVFIVQSFSDARRRLSRHGVVVLPPSLVSLASEGRDEPDRCPFVSTEEFDGMFRSTPELVGWKEGDPIVPEHSGASCWASHQHHPVVRRAMAHYHKCCMQILPGSDETLGFTVHDALVYRPTGVASSLEPAHRDCLKEPVQGMTTYGGWHNPCARSQTLWCQPGSHLAPGVAPAAAVVASKLSEARMVRIEVPPGHLVVYNGKIKRQADHFQRRLCLAHCRISREDYEQHCDVVGLPLGSNPLCSDLMDRLNAGAVIPLKSGKMPLSYTEELWRSRRHELEAFATAVHPACTTLRRVQTGPNAGDVARVPEMFMPSRRYLHRVDPAKFAPHEPYTREELQILFPAPTAVAA